MAQPANAAPAGGAGDSREGILFAFTAYFLWGFLPLYLKAIAYIPSVEVLAHRIVWSVPVAGVVLVSIGRTADFRRAIRTPRMVAMAALTACMISANWGVYVWAVAVGRTVETALGYYINPLVSIVMGAVLLGERLDRAQIVAVALAAIAVVIMTVAAGGLPWVSLFLALSFATYGFLRKTLPIGPSQGFLLEVLILSVPALLFIGWLQQTGEGHFDLSNPTDMLLLAGCGPTTAIPLILYGFGAKLLRVSTIGILQYVAPTLIFLIAVFVFGEPFDFVRGVAFGLIWAALVIYTWSLFRRRA